MIHSITTELFEKYIFAADIDQTIFWSVKIWLFSAHFDPHEFRFRRQTSKEMEHHSFPQPGQQCLAPGPKNSLTTSLPRKETFLLER